MSISVSRLAVLLLKIFLSAGLVWYAFSKIDVGASLDYLGRVSLWAVAAALALLITQVVLAGLRLKELLALLGARCGVIKAIDVVMIGAFFSQTMISFVGGDAMRVWRIMRSNVSFNLAAQGILFDRAAGFIGLMILMILGLPFLLKILEQPQMRWSLVAVIGLGIAGFVAFLCLSRMPAWLRRWRFTNWLSELSAIAIILSRSSKGIAALVGLSLAIQLTNVAIIYVISVGLEIDVHFTNILLLIPPVLFISMLPISVAGWGVRESAMVVALKLVGVPPPQSLALSICFGLCLLAISLPGGALWFLSRVDARASRTVKSDLSTTSE